jgi:hypothetical protein
VSALIPLCRALFGFALLLLCSARGVPAQESPARHPAIVLPPLLVSGELATLAVLDASGRPAPNSAVILGGGEQRTTDATGRLLFKAPQDQSVLQVSLPDDTASSSATVIAALAEERAGLRIDAVPRILLLKDQFTLRGCCFNGEADSNIILLGGQPAAILAASPVALVVLPNPRTPLGDAQLQLDSSDRTVTTAPITVVSFEVSAAKSKGLPGETGEIRVTVRGTEAPLDIEVRAHPEGGIELAGGNPATKHTPGGQDNSVTLSFTFRRPGEFFFEIRLLPQPPDRP